MGFENFQGGKYIPNSMETEAPMLTTLPGLSFEAMLPNNGTQLQYISPCYFVLKGITNTFQWPWLKEN